jgi:toxin ParE1/3/4
MRVKISEVAESELEAIGNFIAEDNPARADSFVLELLDHCRKLAEHPRRYPLISGLEQLGLRRCPYKAYLILYAVDGDIIDIAHVLHSARDVSRILFSKD